MKTGLVLEGGAFRTIFSSGVCDALLELPRLPDYVVGVSAGIAYGVSYLSRQKGRNLDILLHYSHDRRYMGPGNLLKPGNRRSYFGLEFVYEDIPNKLIPFDYDTFAAYPGEAEAVVTNLDTGKAEYFPVPARDDHFELLQATCALPFLFPIYHLDGKPCMDGGAADGIPYERAFQKGCDGVMVCGCHPGDCHYATGNYFTRRRFMLMKRLMEYNGIDPRRFQARWISGSEAAKFRDTVTRVAQEIKALGPNTRFREKWYEEGGAQE